MKRYLSIFFVLIYLASNAQPGKEATHWHFGYWCNLDFSTMPPTPGFGFATSYAGACANMSDPVTGRLLFMSNGTSVIDSTGLLMSNGFGLLGHTDATQGALAVQKPGSTSRYYIITTDHKGLNKGSHYSEIDMTLNGGAGKVIVKNQVLSPPPVTEKMTAVRHCNGQDFWLLNHNCNSNVFNAYALTAAGINTTPVISAAGTIHQNLSVGNAEAAGPMKASPNGKKLAVVITSDSLPLLEVFDFDNVSGIVSNPITILYHGVGAPYGLSFSPDSKKLYVGVLPGDTISAIYQYDLSSGVPSAILASQTMIFQKKWIGSALKDLICMMQLGPDKKIYVTRFVTDTLAVIDNPNGLGTACNMIWNGQALHPTGYNGPTLPNFVDANYAGIQINIPDVQQCNTFTATTLDAGPGFSNYNWSTGASTQTISIAGPGKYWVTVTNDQGCTRTDTINACLLDPLKADTLACDTFHANVTQGGVLAYNWFDASHNPIRDFTQSGNYYVDINYIAGCAIRDSINLTVVPSPQIDIGPDTSFCKGNLVLNAFCSTCNYQWSTGTISSSVTAQTPNTYWVKVTDVNGCVDSDTMIVKPQLIAFNFEMPNVVTPNEDNINDVIDFGKYQFSSLQIEIYNRWGQKVFESENADAVWKPTGDEGTFFYTAQYKIECGVDSLAKTLKGFITVVR